MSNKLWQCCNKVHLAFCFMTFAKKLYLFPELLSLPKKYISTKSCTRLICVHLYGYFLFLFNSFEKD